MKAIEYAVRGGARWEENGLIADAVAHYQGADIALQAAVLAHGIAEGQHFLERNKRTALVALRTFLSINGYAVDASQEERANWIISLSHGMTVDELAQRLRNALVAEPPASEER